jgi:hypothetical protein
MLDLNMKGGGADPYVYQGSLIRGRGVWDVDELDYIYDFDLLYLEIPAEEEINDYKIAFAPDGLTGWIIAMTNLIEPLPYTNHHPVLFKTENGGDTWSDDPIEVQLGGEDGLEGIQNYLSDSLLAEFFAPDPVPPRDEIGYWMGYYIDMAIDAWGNPHILGTVAPQVNDSTVYLVGDYIAMFHIWTDDQGENWNSFNVGTLKQFYADFVSGDYTATMYNRPQVATTQDGAIVFFSWLDTKIEAEQNNFPNIYFRDYLPTTGTHSDSAENVTLYSAAQDEAFFGCMSHYVFSEETDGNYTCTIPFVYEELTMADPLQPVQFWYIPDFVKSYIFEGIDDQENGLDAIVAQNYPNPFTTTTTIKVNLLQETELTLEIYNLAGMLVKKTEFGNMSKGIHDLVITSAGLSKGVYFYSVGNDAGKATRKMIVQ